MPLAPAAALEATPWRAADAEDGQAAWCQALRETLAGWHPHTGPEPAPSSALATRLLRQSEAQREPLLAILRQRLAIFPSEWIHPSWIAPLVPEDPLLRRWALGAMPPTVRRALLGELPAPRGPGQIFIDRTDAPDWFAGWWHATLWAELAYPLALPGGRDEQQPVSLAWMLREDELETLLAAVGWRALAAAVRELPRDELVAFVYTLPQEQQSALVELARESDPRGAAWLEHFSSLRERFRVPASLAVELALLDLAANAPPAGRGDDAVRIAFRLPRERGQQLRGALDLPDPGLVLPAAEWHRTWHEALRELVTQRKLRLPDLREESMA
jgi:hypothetical protein